MQQPLNPAQNALLLQLPGIGRYLDQCEAGVLPMSPKKYQVLAKCAERALASLGKHPDVEEVVALSPALRELRSNLGMAKAIRLGLLEMPQAVLPSRA